MIFGRAHGELSSRFSGPQVFKFDWQNIANFTPFNISKRLILDKDPNSQLDLAFKAKTIHHSCFSSLLNEEIQLATLPKLRVNFEDYSGGAKEFGVELLNMIARKSGVRRLHTMLYGEHLFP